MNVNYMLRKNVRSFSMIDSGTCFMFEGSSDLCMKINNRTADYVCLRSGVTNKITDYFDEGVKVCVCDDAQVTRKQ